MTKLVICDLDNTLYDWVGYFVPSFYAMVEKAVAILECDREELLDDLRCVHQLHHDSEHPFALLETNIVKMRFPNATRRELARVFDDAFHAFNIERKRSLRLYDGVQEGLDSLRKRQATVVAHTEGKLYSVLDRLRRLDLLDYFSRVYCRERTLSSHVKAEVGNRWLDSFPMQKVVELSQHQRKPNPEVLAEICANEQARPEQCLYIGDSIARDVMMAKNTGVCAAWAKYGTQHSEEDYAALVRVSHWTSEDVEREIKLKEQAAGVAPDIILENSFSEVLQKIERKN
ncbi:HAD family hydrolase [Fontisubflavum oceani]|uniref:HAD family hydrolase n=1 Tax=Fontisubflavum oceani TaxID=2978973 RepID=UPI0025B42C02|nr:HAD family hydrolase [Fontisubflavum oceani]WJY23123.1 HAD family hydrolase [Fontisubflavum oceani]